MKKLLLFLLAIFLTASNTNAQYTKLLDFAGANGNAPRGDLFFDSTFLYGMTSGGGTNNMGIIFKIKPDGTMYSKLLDFDSINGKSPFGSLISDGTFLYGMTHNGGINAAGVIFKIKPDGTGYAKLHDFNLQSSPNGAYPCGSLTFDGIFLYGVASWGGMNNYGTIFKIKPDGTGFAELHDFGLDGNFPVGSLFYDGTFLYGMTNGTNVNAGTIFKIKPDGTGCVNLLGFSYGNDGKYPYGSFISDGIFLYGTTYWGGTSNMGIIFKIKPDGTGYSKLIDFVGGPNGNSPLGSLISDGTFLYGMTRDGGTGTACPGTYGNYGCGVFFKIKLDGTGYSKLVDFNGTANGGNPYGSLISDGTFLYGMTTAGGTNGDGTIFKYALSTTGITETKEATGITIYPNPFTFQTVITFNKEQKNTTIKIMDVIGKEVKTINFTGKQLTIEKAEMKAGIYFVQIIDDNKNVVNRKIVVQ